MKKNQFINIYLLLVIGLIYVNFIICFEDDLVAQIKDYPYDLVKNKMYSGYLDIESSATKKLHYLFVESQNKPSEDPLFLWLNGGPGCSSLLGFGSEHGPVIYNEKTEKMELNNFSWNKNANFIYLESPAGVGFSKGSDADILTDDVRSGIDNLSALKSFFKKFPQYMKNDFYISGESYAGIYVPTLAYNVLNYNLKQKSTDRIKLKGVLIGNGVADWTYDTTPAMIDFAYSANLYSSSLRENYLNFNCKNDSDSTQCKETIDQIFLSLKGINFYDFTQNCEVEENVKYGYTSWISKVSGVRIPQCKNSKEDQFWNDWFNKDDIKEALHVDKSIKFEQCNGKVGDSYYMGTKGSFYLYPKLIAYGLKIWKFSGDTDLAVPTNGTRAWIKKLDLPIIDHYRSWFVKSDKIAGFVQKYDGLTFVTVLGTGHMVPQWKREEAYHMLDCFINNKDL